MRNSFGAGALVACAVLARPALALDKQGSAHGGDVAGAASGFNISGALSLGSALINSSYAARPDNTGLALFRYAAHADIDLIGSRLSIPVDFNMFTDRKAEGARKLAPSEFDTIVGLTSTHQLGTASAVEIGARVEHDRPVDEGTFTQTYVDSRGRLLYALGKAWPALEQALADGGISGYLTLGWFAINPTYAARPDNTGLALFRYANHTELSVWHNRLALGVDTTFFSDRESSNVFRPSELDLTGELIGRLPELELHIAYERDMPLDQGSFVQAFLYALLVCPFDLGLRSDATAAAH